MPTALNAFVGLDLEDILEIEAAAVAAAKNGGAISSWGSAGNSVAKTVDGTPGEVLRACAWAKRQKAPEIYGRNVSRTVVSFARATNIS